MPAGARLRLDPTVNVDLLALSPVARALARAAQQYGLIVRDITNGNVAFYAEDPTTAGAGAYDPAGPLGDVAHWDALKGFPWDRLQLLASRSCTAAPCDQ
jgi:hypothetical protein